MTPEQLDILRAEYSGIDRVDPKRLPIIRKLLEQLSNADLKKLAAARVKFLSPLAANARMRRGLHRNPIKGPGKYDGETYAVRYAHENPDDELGDVEGFGWYGNFSGKIKGRGPFHIITTENNQGFVSGEIFDTEKEMRANWRRLENEYAEFEESAE